MVLRIRNFLKYQGAIKRDWPYRKLFVVERGRFGQLPWQTRGLAALLLKYCDVDGRIDTGSRPPAAAIGHLLRAAPEERKSIGRSLDRLMESGYLAIEWDTNGTQAGQKRDESGTQTGQSRDTGGTETGHRNESTPGNHSPQNLQVSKEVSKEVRKKQRREPGARAVAMAAQLLDAILSHKPDFAVTDAVLSGWARDIEPTLKRVGEERLLAAIHFAHREERGSFWRPNILSGRKLCAQLEALEIQMRQRSSVGRASPRGLTARQMAEMAMLEGDGE